MCAACNIGCPIDVHGSRALYAVRIHVYRIISMLGRRKRETERHKQKDRNVYGHETTVFNVCLCAEAVYNSVMRISLLPPYNTVYRILY